MNRLQRLLLMTGIGLIVFGLMMNNMEADKKMAPAETRAEKVRDFSFEADEPSTHDSSGSDPVDYFK